MAQSRRIHEVVSSAVETYLPDDLGVHVHSVRAEAGDKILAAYRRLDSGLGGCPFAQGKMVGNIPTEEVPIR